MTDPVAVVTSGSGVGGAGGDSRVAVTTMRSRALYLGLQAISVTLLVPSWSRISTWVGFTMKCPEGASPGAVSWASTL